MFNHLLLIRLLVQVVEDLTQFYKETFSNYQTTKQEALKETLRGIHFGLNCCGPTGTVFDGANDICPKKEGLNILVTTSCPTAIDGIFNNKLHIIGGVGIGIGVVTVRSVTKRRTDVTPSLCSL
uniref:CD9 antigen n=1 Tax=Oryzias sinensis TaxID=183150 RepID=A0A8C7ZQV4_9TELE